MAQHPNQDAGYVHIPYQQLLSGGLAVGQQLQYDFVGSPLDGIDLVVRQPLHYLIQVAEGYHQVVLLLLDQQLYARQPVLNCFDICISNGFTFAHQELVDAFSVHLAICLFPD